MCRGLTSSRTASSWPLQSRGGWLVMMAVIRCLRVGGRGPVDVLRWGRRLLALVPAGGRGVHGDVDRGDEGVGAAGALAGNRCAARCRQDR